MTQIETITLDVIFENILGFMLPFFLSSADGDAELASDAIRELAEAYNVASAIELELVGRILGFSTVAMDNLRLSMNPEMSDTKVLRYRSNAVALSRAGEECRKILEIVQAGRNRPRQPITIPAPAVTAAPPSAAKPQPARSANNKPAPVAQVPTPSLRAAGPSFPPLDIEAMKRDARAMLAAFPNKGAQPAQSAASFPNVPDPAALVTAAVKQAFVSARPTRAV